MYDTYIFDLYGTLVDIHTDEDKEELWELIRKSIMDEKRDNNFTAQEIKEMYQTFVKYEKFTLEGIAKAKRSNEEYDVEIDIANVIEKMLLVNGLEKNEELDKKRYMNYYTVVCCIAEYFRKESREYLRLYEGAEDLLKELKAKGKRVILLSNAQALFTEPELRDLDLKKYFDRIYLSSDYGVRKPDQTFFALPYEDFKLDKKKTIMIGNDQTTDIAGAREFGYDTCYLHSNISPEKVEPVNATYSIDPIDLNELRKLIIK